MSRDASSSGCYCCRAAYTYAEVEDILAAARAKEEDPFIILLDGIEDPHNLGAYFKNSESGRCPRDYYP